MKKVAFFGILCFALFNLMAQSKGTQFICPSYSFPFFENFDAYDGEDVVQECWTHMDLNHEYPKLSDERSLSGNYSIHFNSYMGKNMEAVKIPGSYNMRNVQLKFAAFSPNANNFIIIGVTSDASNLETYEAVDTIYLQNANRWERFSVALTRYTGNGKYLTFSCDGVNEIYLDDIRLDNPSCDMELPAYETFESYELGLNSCWRNVTIPNNNVIDYNPTDTTWQYNAVSIYLYDTTYANVSTTPTTFTYTGSAQTYTAAPGIYTLEIWGAEGGGVRLSGNSSSGTGGLGGYSTGVLSLTAPTTLYIYVGGYGSSSSSGNAAGGWNGGGQGYGSGSGEPGNGGGGGTDVRINSTSLYARVIVAGGGGGGGEDAGDSYGHGGGTSGQGYASYDATQTSAGTNGSFGQGGGTNYGDGGGGGGGWYGGGTTSSSSSGSDTQGGGGGSGYVYTASTAGYYPAGCLLNSSHYLTNAYTTAGNQSFPSTTGSTETGHQGHGYCKIYHDSIYIDHIDAVLDQTSIDTILTYNSHSLVIMPGTNPSFVVSPKITTGDLHINCISFDVFSTEEEEITMGFMTSQNNAGSFSDVKVALTQPDSWTHVVCNNLPNDINEKYLAFKSNGANKVYIDNLDFSLALSVNDEEITPQKLQIIPNPATSYIDLRLGDGTRNFEKVEVYTMFGTLVKSYGSISGRISVADLANGVYILRADNAIAKFVKN